MVFHVTKREIERGMELEKVAWFLVCTALLSLISGCSTALQQSFHGKDVHFKLVNYQSMNGAESYTIQITSTSSIELTHLSLYLSFPIKIQNGSRSNPFEIRGRTNQPIVTLDKGQSVQFTFYAPIKQVFGNSKLLNFKNPDIELDGYSKQGNTETPFAMGGNLSLYLS